MIYEALKLPLPIYDRLEKQYRFSKGEAVNPVIVSRDRIIPFQWKVDSIITHSDITSWKVTKTDPVRTLAYDLTSQINKLELVATADGNTYIIYKAADIDLIMSAGQYQLEWTIGTEFYFSEVFEVRCDSPVWNDEESTLAMFEYDNNGCDLGEIMYQTGYKNRIYIDSDTHNDAPTVEEEGSNDGAGNFIATTQKYIDNLSIEYICPRYLMDALTLMCIHKNKSFTSPHMLYSGEIINVKPTSTQESGSWNWKIVLSFQQESKYLNAHCCSNIKLVDPIIINCGDIGDILITEGESGQVQLSWSIYGEIDRLHIEWSLENEDCPESGSANVVYVWDSATPIQTTYLFPTNFRKGTFNLILTAQCNIDGEWVSKPPKTSIKPLINGFDCDYVPPIPEPGTGNVWVENNSIAGGSAVITEVTGIPGYTSEAVFQGSSHSGTHGAIVNGALSIRVKYSTTAILNYIVVKKNGVRIYCKNFSSGAAMTINFGNGTFEDSDDITIELNAGKCS